MAGNVSTMQAEKDAALLCFSSLGIEPTNVDLPILWHDQMRLLEIAVEYGSRPGIFSALLQLGAQATPELIARAEWNCRRVQDEMRWHQARLEAEIEGDLDIFIQEKSQYDFLALVHKNLEGGIGLMRLALTPACILHP